MCALREVTPHWLSDVWQFVPGRVQTVSHNILNSHSDCSMLVCLQHPNNFTLAKRTFHTCPRDIIMYWWQHCSGADNTGPSDFPFSEHRETEKSGLQEDLLTVTTLLDGFLSFKCHNMKPSLIWCHHSLSLCHHVPATEHKINLMMHETTPRTVKVELKV